MIVSKKPQRKVFDFLRGKQSGLALPTAILIVVVLIIAGGVGYYFYRTLQEQKEAERVEPEQVIVIDETAGWEIYTNPNVNFTFRYPKDWEIREDYEYKTPACEEDPECKGRQYIVVGKIGEPALPIKIGINIPQLTGVKWSGLPGGNWICVFDEDPEVLDIYEYIKESFGIIKEDETADWKVYSNEGYGFEAKYPPVWELSEKTEILPSIRLEPVEKHFKVEISFFVISPELKFAGIPRTEREGAPETFRQEKTRIENCSNKKVIGNTEFCIEDFACFEGAKLTEYSTINQNKNLIVKSYFTHSSGNFLKCLSNNEVKIELSDFNQILSTFKFIK